MHVIPKKKKVLLCVMQLPIRNMVKWDTVTMSYEFSFKIFSDLFFDY